ncbi:MAG: TIGR03619 family F420-dependent LLM class oxidoreductase [Acidimicrobiia bacterium]
MRYWLNAGFLETEQLVPVALAAERLGYEGITLPDHLVFPEQIDSAYPYSADGAVMWPIDTPWPECWAAIAALAAVTDRLRFTTGVLVAPLRDVFSLAKAVGTAAGFGPGRVSCGLGAGWLREEFDVVGQDFATRGPRLDEMLEALPLLWTGDTVQYHGKHVDFGPIRMRPAAGDVPILIGGNTTPALRRAARHDGWIGTFTDLDDVARMLAELAELRDRLGRDGAGHEVLFAATPGVARDAGALDELGVDGLIVPAVALASSRATDDVIAGLDRFAERRMMS